MTLLTANVVCVILAVIDATMRAWRLQWLLSGVGTRLGYRDAVTANSVGEALGAVTPLRFGGTPAQLATLTRMNVPVARGIAVAGVEAVVYYPMIVAVAIVIASSYGGEWWRLAGPRLLVHLRDAGPWVAAVLVASVLAWWIFRGRIARTEQILREEIRRALSDVRRMPRWPVIANLPADLALIGSRVAILPVLASTVAHGPPLGVTIFASFVLLYGQLVLPTPSGVGAVELGFLSGAAGQLGPEAATLLLLWRFYTTGTGIVLAIVLGLPRYGVMPAVRRFRKRTVSREKHGKSGE